MACMSDKRINAKAKHLTFYKTKEWENKRHEILERDNFECTRCRSNGLFSPAQCIHHIKHLGTNWELRLAEDNLTSLCNVCHNVVHPEKLKVNDFKELLNEERWE